MIASFIRCESDEAFISWVVGFQALMALHEALSGGFDAISMRSRCDLKGRAWKAYRRSESLAGVMSP